MYIIVFYISSSCINLIDTDKYDLVVVGVCWAKKIDGQPARESSIDSQSGLIFLSIPHGVGVEMTCVPTYLATSSYVDPVFHQDHGVLGKGSMQQK